MKTILMLAHDDEGQEARLQVALDLTRGLRGHLTCLDVVTVPAFVGDYVAMGGDALLLQDEEDREEINRIRLDERLAKEDVPFDIKDGTGDTALCLREAAMLADLIVVNRKIDDVYWPNMQELASDLILDSGRPVLAVPGGARGLDVGGDALVAWDGSDAAAAALRAAVPLLRLAKSVTLIAVDERTIKAPATEAAHYLARYGINALVRHESGDAASVIAKAACGAAYIVMGGFGHKRWVQSVFGGVTRTMLAECAVPVFFAH